MANEYSHSNFTYTSSTDCSKVVQTLVHIQKLFFLSSRPTLISIYIYTYISNIHQKFH